MRSACYVALCWCLLLGSVGYAAVGLYTSPADASPASSRASYNTTFPPPLTNSGCTLVSTYRYSGNNCTLTWDYSPSVPGVLTVLSTVNSGSGAGSATIGADYCPSVSCQASVHINAGADDAGNWVFGSTSSDITISWSFAPDATSTPTRTVTSTPTATPTATSGAGYRDCSNLNDCSFVGGIAFWNGNCRYLSTTISGVTYDGYCDAGDSAVQTHTISLGAGQVVCFTVRTNGSLKVELNNTTAAVDQSHTFNSSSDTTWCSTGGTSGSDSVAVTVSASGGGVNTYITGMVVGGAATSTPTSTPMGSATPTITPTPLAGSRDCGDASFPVLNCDLLPAGDGAFGNSTYPTYWNEWSFGPTYIFCANSTHFTNNGYVFENGGGGGMACSQHVVAHASGTVVVRYQVTVESGSLVFQWGLANTNGNPPSATQSVAFAGGCTVGSGTWCTGAVGTVSSGVGYYFGVQNTSSSGQNSAWFLIDSVWVGSSTSTNTPTATATGTAAATATFTPGPTHTATWTPGPTSTGTLTPFPTVLQTAIPGWACQVRDAGVLLNANQCGGSIDDPGSQVSAPFWSVSPSRSAAGDPYGCKATEVSGYDLMCVNEVASQEIDVPPGTQYVCFYGVVDPTTPITSISFINDDTGARLPNQGPNEPVQGCATPIQGTTHLLVQVFTGAAAGLGFIDSIAFYNGTSSTPTAVPTPTGVPPGLIDCANIICTCIKDAANIIRGGEDGVAAATNGVATVTSAGAQSIGQLATNVNNLGPSIANPLSTPLAGGVIAVQALATGVSSGSSQISGAITNSVATPAALVANSASNLSSSVAALVVVQQTAVPALVGAVQTPTGQLVAAISTPGAAFVVLSNKASARLDSIDTLDGEVTYLGDKVFATPIAGAVDLVATPEAAIQDDLSSLHGDLQAINGEEVVCVPLTGLCESYTSIMLQQEGELAALDGEVAGLGSWLALNDIGNGIKTLINQSNNMTQGQCSELGQNYYGSLCGVIMELHMVNTNVVSGTGTIASAISGAADSTSNAYLSGSAQIAGAIASLPLSVTTTLSSTLVPLIVPQHTASDFASLSAVLNAKMPHLAHNLDSLRFGAQPNGSQPPNEPLGNDPHTGDGGLNGSANGTGGTNDSSPPPSDGNGSYGASGLGPDSVDSNGCPSYDFGTWGGAHMVFDQMCSGKWPTIIHHVRSMLLLVLAVLVVNWQVDWWRRLFVKPEGGV